MKGVPGLCWRLLVTSGRQLFFTTSGCIDIYLGYEHTTDYLFEDILFLCVRSQYLSGRWIYNENRNTGFAHLYDGFLSFDKQMSIFERQHIIFSRQALFVLAVLCSFCLS